MSILRVLAKDCVEPNVVGESGDALMVSQPASNQPLMQKERYKKSDVRKRKAASSSITTTENIELSNGNQQVAQQKSITVEEQEQFMVSWRRILLLIMAVTVHNIPGTNYCFYGSVHVFCFKKDLRLESGMLYMSFKYSHIKIRFGSIGSTKSATFESAFNLALGIGLQNFPEGLAVSLPLCGFGYSRLRAFIYGQLSGMVEPIAALLGAAAVILMEPVLPYALSFAAGAMIYVVFDDIIPEAQRNDNGKLASFGAMLGFTGNQLAFRQTVSTLTLNSIFSYDVTGCWSRIIKPFSLTRPNVYALKAINIGFLCFFQLTARVLFY
jgi:zinc transporter ZupT